MAKKKSAKNETPETTPKKSELKRMRRAAERKLEKAQRRLARAQDEFARTREKGEAAIEQARQASQEMLEKAGKEVEKRAAAVARAQAQMDALQPRTPEEAADVLAEKIAESPVPDEPVVSSNGRLTTREALALHALQGIESASGVTFAAWREAAHMPNTTLSRVRDRLVEEGYITRTEENGRNVRYWLTERGRTA